MILEFSITNTYSIGEKQTISFEPASYDKENKNHYIDIDGIKILKLACIYGSNAAGKTNMAVALNFYLRFMAYSFYTTKPEEKIPFVPYFFETENLDDVCGEFDLVCFAYSTEEKKYIKYHYYLRINRNEVLEESLNYYPKRLPRLIFNRNKMNIEWGNSVKGAKKAMEDILISNCSLISASSKTKISVLNDVFFYIVNRYKGFFSPFNNEIPQSLLEKLDNDESLKNKATGFLSFADFGSISDISIKKEIKESNENLSLTASNNKEKTNRRASLVHKYNQKEYPLPLGLESAGTIRVLELIEPLVNSSESSLTIIDEIEASLHQDLIEAFLRLFLELSKNAQLLFTTHNQELLDSGLILDDEVWFCTKTQNGNSVYNSISDFTGFRKEVSRKKLYQAGKFGGLPNIDIQGLKELFYGKKKD